MHRRMDQVARRHLGRGLELAGVVPFDFSVVAAVKRRKPLALESPDALATRAIRTIAHSLITDAPVTERSARKPGFLTGLLRSLAVQRSRAIFEFSPFLGSWFHRSVMVPALRMSFIDLRASAICSTS